MGAAYLAGLASGYWKSKEEIAKISGCEDQEMQIRMLRKYQYKLLDEVHEKQQSLDAIDYMICKTKK